jgi:hypothetical protein
MTRDERQEFVKILRAHLHTISVCDACAVTTRDLAAEVARGGLPSREDLTRTVDEAERVLADVSAIRGELQRVLAGLGEPV